MHVTRPFCAIKPSGFVWQTVDVFGLLFKLIVQDFGLKLLIDFTVVADWLRKIKLQLLLLHLIARRGA